MTLAEIFYRNVRMIREAKGLSARALSREMGKSHSAWSFTMEGLSASYAKEMEGPKLSSVEKAAEILGVDPLLLLDPDLVVETTTKIRSGKETR